jgi:hypothetical protein
MFLDAVASDGEWLGRYALNREGQVIPWDIIKQEIENTHPYQV